MEVMTVVQLDSVSLSEALRSV